MKNHNTLLITLITFLALLVLTLALTLTSSLTPLESARIVFGSLYVLFLPGFILSFVFFKSSTIDILERIALSFALSIAIVPLAVFYLNLIGLRISTLNTTLTILGIIILSTIILLFQKRRQL